MRSRWLGSAALFVGVVLLCGHRGYAQPPAGGGFPGGPGGGGFPGGPGGGGFGGKGGGFGNPGGGMRGGDPEAMWQRMSGGADSMDLNQPQNQWLKGLIERGGNPVPPNGILTKQQFMAGMQQMQQKMAARAGGGAPGGQPGVVMAAPGGQPVTMSFQGGPGGGGRDFGRQRFDGGPGGPGGWNGGPPGGNWNGQGGNWNGPGGGGYPGGPGGQFNPNGDGPGGPGGKEEKKKEEPDFNQIGIRYGKLPPGLPDWFTELDTDRDGQVGLYEWRAAGRKTADFNLLDADGDGLIAPREWLRGEAIKAETDKLTAAAEGSDATPTRAPSSRGSDSSKSDTVIPAGKGDRGKWGGGGGDRKKGKN